MAEKSRQELEAELEKKRGEVADLEKQLGQSPAPAPKGGTGPVGVRPQRKPKTK